MPAAVEQPEARASAAASPGLPVLLATDILDALDAAAVTRAAEIGGISVAGLRATLVIEARRRASLGLDVAALIADTRIALLIQGKRLVRDGDRILPEGAGAGPDLELRAAMARLEFILAVAAPPPLAVAAREAGCSMAGIRALETGGRIVRLEDDLAWHAETLAAFEALAVRLASAAPLTPAAFRDATGTSRRYALAILEDLGRRGVLRRTPAGHEPGPRASSVGAAPHAAPA